jgi:hypothetical protein
MVEKTREKYSQGADKSSEITQYLQCPLCKFEDNPFMQWENMKGIYPTLAKLAPRYLSIVATSVPSERLFSKAGLILTQQRNKLKGKRLSKLLFLHSCDSNMF